MTDDNVVDFPSDPSDVGRAILQITNDLTRIANQVTKFVALQKKINEQFDRQIKDVLQVQKAIHLKVDDIEEWDYVAVTTRKD
tara:strand:+ start:655 stop:903 length:249 start_codon:yes stop_codon:yes gene_type:complete